MRGRRLQPTVGVMSAYPASLSPSGPWSRVFALVYDPSLALGEVAGLRRRRRRLLAAARGRVVEIGAGTGLNLRHYPDGLEALTLVEPDAAMRRRLEGRVRRGGARGVDAGRTGRVDPRAAGAPGAAKRTRRGHRRGVRGAAAARRPVGRHR